MKVLEIRRHSVRNKPEEQLSENGRALAADVGRGRGPFRIVVSSTSPRAVETAEAMGFPPQRRSALWLGFPTTSIPWPMAFEGYGAELRSNPVARSLAVRLRTGLTEIVARLEADQQALIVSHGGIPEMAAAIWSSPEQLVRLGSPCKCMEGVLLRFDANQFVDAVSLRVAEARTRM